MEDISGRLNELLQPVYFDFDKSDLKYDAISRLEMIASFLREHHPSVRLLAQGHADERGSSESTTWVWVRTAPNQCVTI